MLMTMHHSTRAAKPDIAALVPHQQVAFENPA
jgi:hypothetical protein